MALARPPGPAPMMTTFLEGGISVTSPLDLGSRLEHTTPKTGRYPRSHGGRRQRSSRGPSQYQRHSPDQAWGLIPAYGGYALVNCRKVFGKCVVDMASTGSSTC